MRNKSLWFHILLFFVVLICHPAKASTYTYSVSATVTEISHPDFNTIFSLGSALTGQITLDDAQPNTSPFSNSSWYLGSVTQAHFNTGTTFVNVLGGYTGVQSSIGISFAAGPLFGIGGLISSNDVNNWILSGWSLMLTDTQHIITNNDFPDAHLLTNNGLHREMFLTYTNQAGNLAYISADVSQIVSISAVPEPSSILMTVAGLLALLFTRRKRRSYHFK